MDNYTALAIDLGIVLILFAGIWLFRSPRSARAGNLSAALAILCALAAVFYRHEILEPRIVLITLAAGSLIGSIVAMRVTMLQIPSMVAFQHGAGGVAAFLISTVELTRGAELAAVAHASGLLGLVIGAATFSGSMIAGGKLSNRIKQTPVFLPFHNGVLVLLATAIILLCALSWNAPEYGAAHVAGVVILSIVLGVVFSIRIGGADMPVLISFLNATAGLAAAFCGIIIQNRLLIVCGATVAASGSILTHVMCKAMNRNLANIFTGIKQPQNRGAVAVSEAIAEPAPLDDAPPQDPWNTAIEALRSARFVIFVPGYGMALAQAQFKVVELSRMLESGGAEVKFAIHPIAGRMPGHMNVLLAEADLPYDRLVEMDAINPEFARADSVVVVGACDVVNPAANTAEGTPIYGMPILEAHKARRVMVCNMDTRPGYSGVNNTLYANPNTLLLLGNAAETIERLIEGLKK